MAEARKELGDLSSPPDLSLSLISLLTSLTPAEFSQNREQGKGFEHGAGSQSLDKE